MRRDSSDRQAKQVKHLIYSRLCPIYSVDCITISPSIFFLYTWDKMKLTTVFLFAATAWGAQHHHRRDTTDNGINLSAISSALYLTLCFSEYFSNNLTLLQRGSGSQPNNHCKFCQHLAAAQISHLRDSICCTRIRHLGTHQPSRTQFPRQSIQGRHYPSLVRRSPNGCEKLHVGGQVADLRGSIDGHNGRVQRGSKYRDSSGSHCHRFQSRWTGELNF